MECRVSRESSLGVQTKEALAESDAAFNARMSQRYALSTWLALSSLLYHEAGLELPREPPAEFAEEIVRYLATRWSIEASGA